MKREGSTRNRKERRTGNLETERKCRLGKKEGRWKEKEESASGVRRYGEEKIKEERTFIGEGRPGRREGRRTEGRRKTKKRREEKRTNEERAVSGE